jgi:uncharacterized membrane protein
MSLLIAGILIWSVMHFLPALDPEFRKNLIARMGEPPYKGVFGLLMLAAIGLIILGWRATTAVDFYIAPEWGVYPAFVLMLATFILFFSPYIRNSFSRMIRHPQLTGVILGCVGHLLASGTNRSVIFFGGFAVWSIIEIALLNRRNGPWEKPEPAPISANVRLILTGLGFFALFLFTHLWLFDVSPIPE